MIITDRLLSATIIINPDLTVTASNVSIKPSPFFRDARCVHNLGVTDQSVRCGACRGVVNLKLFACGLHGLCTVRKKAPGYKCCAPGGGCDDYSAADD